MDSFDELRPFKLICNEIEGAFGLGLYQSALIMALRIPDVCAALRDPKGLSSGMKYAAWYDEVMGSYARSITGQQCYKMRCGVVHQSRASHPDMILERAVFSINSSLQILAMDGSLIDGRRQRLILIDLGLFCKEIVQRSFRWLSENAGNPMIRANLPLMMTYRPEGFGNGFQTPPVIA